MITHHKQQSMIYRDNKHDRGVHVTINIDILSYNIAAFGIIGVHMRRAHGNTVSAVQYNTVQVECTRAGSGIGVDVDVG
jgi:hypothetical protein